MTEVLTNNQNQQRLHACEKRLNDPETFIIVSMTNALVHLKLLQNHIPHHIMRWQTRRNKILQELDLISPDTLCLQEDDHYDDLNEELVGRGYRGVFKAHTKIAKNCHGLEGKTYSSCWRARTLISQNHNPHNHCGSNLYSTIGNMTPTTSQGSEIMSN